MNKRVIFAAVTTALIAGAMTAPVLAQSEGDRGAREDRSERSVDRGNQRRGGQRLTGMLELYDTDGDGSITQGEIDSVRSDRLAEFDADQDGQLALEEYQALWLDAMRERMVDRFQSHDDDGDGVVTIEEFSENFTTIVADRDNNGDGVLNADDFGNGRQGQQNNADDNDGNDEDTE